MSVRLFLRIRSGDYNLEEKFEDVSAAGNRLHEIQTKQGYWTTDRGGRMIWVPWHSVDVAIVEHE